MDRKSLSHYQGDSGRENENGSTCKRLDMKTVYNHQPTQQLLASA